MPLREFFFKTTADNNLLCQFTKREAGSWILIHLFRRGAGLKAERALFTICAKSPAAAERFLVEEFGRRYGTYEVISKEPGYASVEVSNYMLPQYRGLDPLELTTQMLGKDAFLAPILVEGGYIHIKVIANPANASARFGEMLKRITAATSPTDFKLLHAAPYDPVLRLKPRNEQLSPRQEEMLRMAIEFGYYDEPRRCTLDTLAKQFGVSKAAVHKRLISAESKIIKAYAR